MFLAPIAKAQQLGLFVGKDGSSYAVFRLDFTGDNGLLLLEWVWLYRS
jgi:hypothetical protein